MLGRGWKERSQKTSFRILKLTIYKSHVLRLRQDPVIEKSVEVWLWTITGKNEKALRRHDQTRMRNGNVWESENKPDQVGQHPFAIKQQVLCPFKSRNMSSVLSAWRVSVWCWSLTDECVQPGSWHLSASSAEYLFRCFAFNYKCIILPTIFYLVI